MEVDVCCGGVFGLWREELELVGGLFRGWRDLFDLPFCWILLSLGLSVQVGHNMVSCRAHVFMKL